MAADGVGVAGGACRLREAPLNPKDAGISQLKQGSDKRSFMLFM